jgi:hypothetical protein
MRPGFIRDLQDPSGCSPNTAGIEADASVSLLAGSDGGIPVDIPFEISLSPALPSLDGASGGILDGSDRDIAVRPIPNENVSYLTANGVMDDAAVEGTGGMATGTSVPTPAMPMHTFAALTNQVLANPLLATLSAGSIEAHIADASISYGGATAAHR